MSQWSVLAQAVAALLTALTEAARRRREHALAEDGRHLGRLEALHEVIAETAERVGRADHIRVRVHLDLRDNPERLRADDGYRRD